MLIASLCEAQPVDLHRMQERLERVHARLESGESSEAVASELAAIRTAYARRVERLAAELDRADAAVRDLALGAVAAERLEKARSAFETSHTALLEGLDRLTDSPDLSEIEACLRALEPMADAEREDILSAQELPLREIDLTPPPLSKQGPPTTASFAVAVDEASLADSIGSVPDAIRELAAELDGPVAAYELVKNQTRFELYFGSMKGSVQTLREGSGNDADISRLLVDLLRAEGVPARYVRGVVRLTMAQAQGLIGTERAERVEQALSAALVPYEPVFVGGGVGAVEIEHIWVEAYLPWSNYRGTGVDSRGRRWVPLDASFKFHTVDEGHRVLEAMGFDAETFVRDALEAAPQTDPLAVLRADVTAYLDANVPGVSYDDALRKLVQTPEVYGILPASLPYEVISIGGVSFEFPEELAHQVRFIATREDGVVILDSVQSISRLIGRRLTLSYAPASAEDRETADAFGSIYQTPPFLIEVRPVLRSAGLVIDTGGPIAMGGRFELESHFRAPAGVVSVDNRMIAGAYAALAISGRTPGYEELAETQAGEILNQRALNYLSRWNDADRELAGLTRVATFRPVPSHVIVKNAIHVDYASGDSLVPLTFEWKGIQVDADLRPTAPVSVDSTFANQREFFFLSGLIGSELEGRILEEDLSLNAVSTVELMRLAISGGIEVREIDSSNVDTELALIDLEPELENAIAAHAYLGRTIRAPISELTFLAWTGSGFTAWDPLTGESAYLLSGRIAGGSSADPPAEFPDALREFLEIPTEPISEPSRIVGSIEIVDSSNFQEALVGHEVRRELEVIVYDEEGNPVADGVPVVFTAVDETSLLFSVDRAEEGTSIAVATVNGRARALLRLGTSTRDNRRFVRETAGDKFLTQVGVYRVTAEAGGVALEDPFAAFAFPNDEADELGRHGQLLAVSGRVLAGLPLHTPNVPMWVEVVDPFRNPLSNMTVDWEVLEATRLPGITEPLPDVFDNGKLHGEVFDELKESDERLTSAFGSLVYARLGDVDATRYKYAASRSDVKYPRDPIEFFRDSDDLGASRASGPIGERMFVFFIDRGVPLQRGSIVYEGAGGAVSAPALTMGKVNSWLPGTVGFNVRAYQENHEAVEDAEGKWFLRGLGRFTERDVTDAEVTARLLEGSGKFDPETLTSANGDGGIGYEFRFGFGPDPGVRRYGYSVAGTLTRPVIDRDTGEESTVELQSTRSNSGLGSLLFGVTARVVRQFSDPFLLDGSGHLLPGSFLDFEILPAVVDEVLARETVGKVIRVTKNNQAFAFGELPDVSPLVFNTVLGYEPNNVYQATITLLPGTSMELSSEPLRLQFFNAFMKKSNPRPIFVQEVPDPDDPDPLVTKFITRTDTDLEYFIRPSTLSVTEAKVELYEVEGEGPIRLLGELPGAGLSGDGAAVLLEGFRAEPDKKEYAAILKATTDGGAVIRSEPEPILFNRLLFGVKDPVYVTFQVGAGESCFVPEPIQYFLDADADVTISVLEVEGPFDDAVTERVVFSGRQLRRLPPFPLTYLLGPSDLLNASAKYKFRIQAVSVENPDLKEVYIGDLNVKTTGNVVLPVGHTFIKGVDLSDGHLVSSSTDLSIPGRGPSLELVRTYGSAGRSSRGVMGAGWSMNYYSTLIVSDCAWTIRGGDGSGQRFTKVGAEFVPQKGYHTELVENPDGSFDFFTKGRIRYHYLDRVIFEGDRLYGGRPTLEFIEDPNGNRLELTYDAQRNITEVKEVFQGGAEGRSLLFEYARVRDEERLKRVTGPLGSEVTYEYDEFANLIRATRDERIEHYDYDVANLLDQHNLTAYTDPNGNTTRYRYYTESDEFPGEIAIDPSQGKYEWVKAVDEPEGVTTNFVYDLTRITSGEFVTTVTDGRRNDTIYTLNLNGSPLKIEEPDGIITSMTWAADDIFKLSETDANGRTTLFEYDVRANLTKETIVTDDFGDVVTEFAYDPIFNKMTLKRVHNSAVLQETHFAINAANGNLEQTRDAESNITTFEYFPNGDLQFVRGPRPGQVTEFAYGAFGNPATTTDAESNVTTTVYDERSRPRSSSDTFGRSMTQDFDELDRVTTVTRADDKGSSDTEVIVRDHYPGGQSLFERNGLGLSTNFTIDGLNRLSATRDDLGNTTSTTYDRNSNVEEQTDRRGVTTVNTYDKLNRLTRAEIRGPFGPHQILSEMDYDDVGNKLFQTDLHGSRTDFVYDDLYRVRVRQLPTGHEERFVFDLVGNIVSQFDANGNETRAVYDRLNRVTSRTDAEDNEVRFEYDAAGNVDIQEDVTRGLTTTVTYDLLNRPLSQTLDGAIPDAFTHETTFVYNDVAHEIVETDPRGFDKTTVLDGFYRVHERRQEVEAGRELVTRNFYDANGNLKQTEDAELRTTDFIYDGLNRLKEVRDALSQSIFFDYDGEGNQLEEVNRRNLPTRFSYDNLGRLTRTEIDQPITGGGTLTTSQILYLDSQRKRLEFDARNNRTTFEMDERQRVVKITDADNEFQLFEYDGVNKTDEVDKRVHRVGFRYDRINRLIEIEDALGQTITTVYRDAARQVIETDKKLLVKTTQLDALGCLISVTRSGINLEEHGYDGNNNRVLSTDANGNQTQFLYDGANRLTERIDGLASDEETRTTFLYDDVGNLLEEKDGRDTGVAFDIRNAYDELNRLETTTDAEGNTTTFDYDEEGNRTAVIEPKSIDHRTEFDYGELNELIEVRMPDGGVYNYTYDGNRNRIRQQDGESNVVTFTYDRLNRVDLMIQDPSGFNYVTDHDYDANGNEIRLVDPKGQVIRFTYDELNRLDQKTYELTADDLALLTRTHEITFHYDPNDNLERVDELKSSGTDPPAIVSSFKSYDTLDRLTSETDAWGRILTYDYDNQGNRTSLTDPDSVQTEYTFDELNRLETLTLEAGTPSAQTVVYDYFPDSLKKTVTNPNATSSTYTYDAADRMETITHNGPGGVVSAYIYEYDPNGNRSQQIETNAGRTETTLYDYDLVNRLKVVTYEAGTTDATQVTYNYDQVGNRLTEQEVVLDTSTVTKDLVYAYDPINRLDTIDDLLGTDDVAYEFDPNGNTRSKTKAGVTTEFKYDIRDQLGEVLQGTSILGRYGYDYNRRRILKLGDDGIRRYSYDQLSVVTEANEANATVSKYDYGLDQLVSLDNTVEGRSFCHLDILRSTVSLSDAAGSTRQSIFYDAWGNERDRVGSSANKFTFTGHEKDEETGLIYAKARFYDPDIGRFLTQDSFLGDVGNVPSLHRYAYANANPVRFVDRTGRQSDEVEEGGSLLQAIDEFWINRTSMRIPSEFEMWIWSVTRQIAGGDSLFQIAKEQAERSLPPTNIQPDVFLIGGEEAEKIKRNRELAEDALEFVQTLDEISKALDPAQEENLRDADPRVVEESDDGTSLVQPAASFDPRNPRSGKVEAPPTGVTTTRNERGELVVIDAERRLRELQVPMPKKPIRHVLPFGGDTPLDRLPPRRNNQGPTQGILVIGDAEQDLISGRGSITEGLRQQQRKGFTQQSETHVEPQAAEVVRRTGATEGTVYINNANGPCGGTLGCDNSVEKILPPGAKLRVVWPGGEKTYEGRETKK